MSERLLETAIRKNTEEFAKIFREEFLASINKKEATTMKVSYNGFTGELVKLEKSKTAVPMPGMPSGFETVYNLEIWDSDKTVTHSFTGVKLEDVKFLGGAVSFGG